MSNARDKANIPVLNFQSKGIDDNATSTAITIDSSGDVGINNTAPNLNSFNKAVTLSGTNNAGYELAKGSTLHGALALQGDNRLQLINFQNADITFNTGTSASERMRITSTGVGIGTSSPSSYYSNSLVVDCGSASQGGMTIVSESTKDGMVSFADGTSGSNRYSGFILYDHADNEFRIATNGSERMRIDSSGNVGIKNTVMSSFSNLPATDLVVGAGTTDSGITIYSGTTHGSNIAFADAPSGNGRNQGIIQYHHNGDYMRFFTSASERMRLNSTGLGIGTSSPRAKLDLGSGSGDSSTISTTASDYQLILEAPQGTGDYGRNIAWCIGNSAVYASINAVDTGSSDKTGLAFVTGDSSGVAEAVRISHDGKIGIGTTSPSATLHADASGGASVKISRTGLGALYLESDGTNGNIRSTSSTGSLSFQTNGNNERMRINSSGVVTVGKTSTGYDVAGVTLSNGGYGAFTQAGNPALILNRLTSEGSIVEFRQANGLRGTISVGGSATAYNTSSDYRLKENVNYDFDATSRLKELKPARFNFIEEADKTVDGFLAHEVSSIVPEAITGTKDAVDEDGNPEYQGIDQSKLVPLLVKTIQELEARITTLEANNP